MPGRASWEVLQAVKHCIRDKPDEFEDIQELREARDLLNTVIEQAIVAHCSLLMSREKAA